MRVNHDLLAVGFGFFYAAQPRAVLTERGVERRGQFPDWNVLAGQSEAGYQLLSAHLAGAGEDHGRTVLAERILDADDHGFEADDAAEFS